MNVAPKPGGTGYGSYARNEIVVLKDHIKL